MIAIVKPNFFHTKGVKRWKFVLKASRGKSAGKENSPWEVSSWIM